MLSPLQGKYAESDQPADVVPIVLARRVLQVFAQGSVGVAPIVLAVESRHALVQMRRRPAVARQSAIRRRVDGRFGQRGDGARQEAGGGNGGIRPKSGS